MHRLSDAQRYSRPGPSILGLRRVPSWSGMGADKRDARRTRPLRCSFREGRLPTGTVVFRSEPASTVYYGCRYPVNRTLEAALILFIFVAPSTAAAGDSKQMDPKAYPADEFRVSQHDYQRGSVSVRVIQAKRLRGSVTPPSYCRASLEVWKGDQMMKQVYYDDIEAVGFSYGIFIPKRQPLPAYFVAVKEGDYDGRLLLIGKDGSLADLPGGFYFVTRDKRYLIGLHAMDSSVLVVVDVAKRQVVIDGEKEGVPEIHSWYRNDAGYFFTRVDESDHSDKPREIRDYVYRLDLLQYRVAKVSISEASLAAAHRLDYDFDPRELTDCASAPQ